MSLLLHPKVTLASLIAGLAAIGASCGSVVVALSPLATVPGLEFVKHDVLALVTFFGAVSAVCIALSAIGRSVAPLIDNNGSQPQDNGGGPSGKDKPLDNGGGPSGK